MRWPCARADRPCLCSFFFFNDTATTEIYTLSLHDDLPIYASPTGFAWLRSQIHADSPRVPGTLRLRTPTPSLTYNCVRSGRLLPRASRCSPFGLALPRRFGSAPSRARVSGGSSLDVARQGALMARKEGLIGRKVGMTQVFGDDGNHLPVTVIEAGPCTILGIRTKDTHGYDALQLGFGAKKKNVSKPAAGLFKKANVAPMRVVREIRLEKTEKLQGYQVGQALTVAVFQPGELVDVVGVSKGKGFQGGVKRYGWYGGDATHGSMFHRAPGSIGASSDPSRVWPGHHLPGRMGGERRTVLNLSVVRVMPEQNLVLVRGAVPGANGSLVMIRKSVKLTKAQQKAAAKK